MHKMLIYLMLLMTTPVAGGAVLTPDAVVRETTNEVLQRLDSDRARLEQDPGYINTIVQDLVIPHFDFDTMARVALGDHWQELDTTTQACFSSGFRNLLVERYADILLSYDQQSLTYDPAKSVGGIGYMSVRQTISRESARPLPVDYPMRQIDNHGWMVVDLVVDGISLLKSYNKSFNEEIKALGLSEFVYSFPECATAD